MGGGKATTINYLQGKNIYLEVRKQMYTKEKSICRETALQEEGRVAKLPAQSPSSGHPFPGEKDVE